MAPTSTRTRPRLKERYDTSTRGELKTQLGTVQHHGGPAPREDRHQHGVGKATQQPSLIEGAVKDLEVISGQKPVVTRARSSIAAFKLREGMPIGAR